MKHQKKKVRYTKVYGEIRIGEPAYILPVDHPSPLVSNETMARTSKVIAFNQEGFETMNTLYIFKE